MRYTGCDAPRPANPGNTGMKGTIRAGGNEPQGFEAPAFFDRRVNFRLQIAEALP
jgi:hypothetical protein